MRAVEWAAREATLRKATLRIVAIPVLPQRGKFPEVEAHGEVVHGHPGRILAGLSARSDLVVLGRHAPGAGTVRESARLPTPC